MEKAKTLSLIFFLSSKKLNIVKKLPAPVQKYIFIIISLKQNYSSRDTIPLIRRQRRRRPAPFLWGSHLWRRCRPLDARSGLFSPREPVVWEQKIPIILSKRQGKNLFSNYFYEYLLLCLYIVVIYQNLNI
jgi:hypothetical protein